ncbi:hypothetical protein, partial [Salmonella sp. gx-f7]|uniref:hypothetical protein n=1 Tax=Salmonella sp. gx-f7 TaxID=2582606 RepID=UPI001F21CDD3
VQVINTQKKAQLSDIEISSIIKIDRYLNKSIVIRKKSRPAMFECMDCVHSDLRPAPERCISLERKMG